MQRIIDTIKLMAKTGLFFANCDGAYTDRERDFVEGFVSGIEQVGSIDDELKEEVLDSINHTYQLDDIVNDTLLLVKDFNDDERKAILATINGVINKVIHVDKKVNSAEQNAYMEWKKRVGLK